MRGAARIEGIERTRARGGKLEVCHVVLLLRLFSLIQRLSLKLSYFPAYAYIDCACTFFPFFLSFFLAFTRRCSPRAPQLSSEWKTGRRERALLCRRVEIYPSITGAIDQKASQRKSRERASIMGEIVLLYNFSIYNGSVKVVKKFLRLISRAQECLHPRNTFYVCACKYNFRKQSFVGVNWKLCRTAAGYTTHRLATNHIYVGIKIMADRGRPYVYVRAYLHQSKHIFRRRAGGNKKALIGRKSPAINLGRARPVLCALSQFGIYPRDDSFTFSLFLSLFFPADKATSRARGYTTIRFSAS